MANKKALCVGINQFQHLPGATLRGCVNDARDMAALLKDKRGYAEQDIQLVLDAQATKAHILSVLSGLVDEAAAGKLDELVFTFSSHGSQTLDLNGDEADGLDEVFCAHDTHPAGNIWAPDSVICDDELNSLFKRIPAPVKLEVFLDTCHSGTGLRAMDPEKLVSMYLYDKPQPVKFRYLPMPSGLMIDRSRAMRAAATRSVPRVFNFPAPSLDSKRLLWAGCKDSQTSADAFFDGRPNGAFTYFYIKTARAAKTNLSAPRIHAKLVAALKAAGYDQDPQLESNPL